MWLLLSVSVFCPRAAVPQDGGNSVTNTMAQFGEYPRVPFDIDADVRRDVLNSCVRHIDGKYYAGRAHGADIVIDTDTAYFNATNLVSDARRMDELLDSPTMRKQIAYIETVLGKHPYYRVSDNHDPRLNGIYMHGITIGNVLSIVPHSVLSENA